MKRELIEQKIETASFERMQIQRALKAANSMMYQLQIPHGNHLAFALNQPDALDNAHAISQWILSEAQSNEVNQSAYAELTIRLKKILFEYQCDGL